MPLSSSTAVTAAPAASRPPVRNPSPGPISRTRSPGTGPASRRIPSSTSTSARKFCPRPCARVQARELERLADVLRVEAQVGGAHRASRRARVASGSDGRASRSRPPMTPAASRRAPAAPIIAPLSVHSAGSRDHERDAPRLGLARDPGPERPVRRDAAAEHDPARPDLLGRADRLRREHVHHRVLEPPRELRDRRARGSAPSRSSAGRPSSARAWPMIRRAAVLSPEKLMS